MGGLYDAATLRAPRASGSSALCYYKSEAATQCDRRPDMRLRVGELGAHWRGGERGCAAESSTRASALGGGGGSGRHMISTAGRENFTSISGLVVEYIVAIDVTRVRFPADASVAQNF